MAAHCMATVGPLHRHIDMVSIPWNVQCQLTASSMSAQCMTNVGSLHGQPGEGKGRGRAGGEGGMSAQCMTNVGSLHGHANHLFNVKLGPFSVVRRPNYCQLLPFSPTTKLHCVACIMRSPYLDMSTVYLNEITLPGHVYCLP